MGSGRLIYLVYDGPGLQSKRRGPLRISKAATDYLLMASSGKAAGL